MKAARLYGAKVWSNQTVIDLDCFIGHASVPIPVPPDVLVYQGKNFILDHNLQGYVLYREAITYDYSKGAY